MNRRITKDMAYNAAQKVAEELYDKKIEEVRTRLTQLADDCVKQVIPAPVLAVIKEYPNYFNTTTNVCISLDGNSYAAVSTIAVPSHYYYLRVGKVIYEQGLYIFNDLQKMLSKKKELKEEIAILLYQELKFEKRVKEAVPEILSYIEFPPINGLPAKKEQYYSTFNNVIKNLKRLKK